MFNVFSPPGDPQFPDSSRDNSVSSTPLHCSNSECVVDRKISTTVSNSLPLNQDQGISSIDKISEQLSSHNKNSSSSRFRIKDRSRSQSDLHLLSEKIPEAVLEEDPENDPIALPAKSLCKRTHSMGTLTNNATERAQEDDFGADDKQMTDLNNRRRHRSSNDGAEKPVGIRSRLLQRDNSFIQSVRTFLRPRDVKKKNKIRTRSESLTHGSPGNGPTNDRGKARSDSFTSYLK